MNYGAPLFVGIQKNIMEINLNNLGHLPPVTEPV